MVVLTRQVDQWIMIGRDIRVSPTDIDAHGVRLVARGRILGGPIDGAKFSTVHELSVGQSCQITPHVAITLLEVRGDTARLGILSPSHVPACSKEEFDRLYGDGQERHGK